MSARTYLKTKDTDDAVQSSRRTLSRTPQQYEAQRRDATRVRVKEQVSEQREWVIESNLRQWPAENVHLYCLLLERTTSSGAVFERAAVAQPEIGGEVKWCSREALIQSPNVCTAAVADKYSQAETATPTPANDYTSTTKLSNSICYAKRPVSRARARLNVNILTPDVRLFYFL